MSITALKYGRATSPTLDSTTQTDSLIDAIDVVDPVETFSLELVHSTRYAIAIEADWLSFTHELGRGIFNKI